MNHKFFLYLAVLWLLAAGCAQQPTPGSLQHSTPEAEGVSSEGIIEFLNAADTSRHEFHGVVFLRHGKVIAEAYWEPFASDLVHTLYSTSKSFTSTAVGFAVTENLLSVDDKIVSFFPEHLPDTVSPFLAGMTIQDALTMSTGQEPEPTWTAVSTDNWIKSFLAATIVDEPGTVFRYNSLATYMLSAIVQEVTGEKVIDYLTPRLFEPLGIEGMDWEVDPMGINTGGWGLRLKTMDMAKFGQLYLEKGAWNGEQVIPASWIAEATSKHIDQAPDLTEEEKASSDWQQGYGYQFWRCRYNAFRADGAFGQFIIVMPEMDAVVAINSWSPDMQDEINLVWDYLLPAMQPETLPEKKEEQSALKEKISSLVIETPPAVDNLEWLAGISGKSFKIDPNNGPVRSIAFEFSDNILTTELRTDTANLPFAFGNGQWKTGETTKPGPGLIAGSEENYKMLQPFRVAGSFTGKEGSLELVLKYIQGPHTETLRCEFKGDSIRVNCGRGFNSFYKEPVLKGVLAGDS